MNLQMNRGASAHRLIPPGLCDPIHLTPQAAPVADGSLDLPLDELCVRLASSDDDMAQIVQLRTEIDLAAAMAADRHFLAHEKKETK